MHKKIAVCICVAVMIALCALHRPVALAANPKVVLSDNRKLGVRVDSPLDYATIKAGGNTSINLQLDRKYGDTGSYISVSGFVLKGHIDKVPEDYYYEAMFITPRYSGYTYTDRVTVTYAMPSGLQSGKYTLLIVVNDDGNDHDSHPQNRSTTHAIVPIYIDGDTSTKTGWVNINGEWYYNLSKTEYARSAWKFIGGKWYYFQTNGAASTSWLVQGDKKYYFDPVNCDMSVGWRVINGRWHYFGSDGNLRKGWLYWQNNWYYLGSRGEMSTGWAKDWNDGHWYYLHASGKMMTGWLKQDAWYFLDTKSGRMHTGWKWYKDGWYYMDADGRMLTGMHTIDGQQYTFDENGIMQ